MLNDFYGGGTYFTDEKSVAVSYARGMAKKQGLPLIYECNLRPKKVFDVDSMFTGSDLKQFVNKSNAEVFAKGAKLLSLGVDPLAIRLALEQGNITLSGDQVFRGLSNGMVNTAKAREMLIRLGFDCLRYNGGVNMSMSQKHNVYVAYKANIIDIIHKYIVPSMQMVDDLLVEA